jgi:hypothetical protein
MQVLRKNDKFSFVAVENCAHAPSAPIQLTDRTLILTSVPGELNENWVKWIGETRTEALADSNFVLLRNNQSANPSVLDLEHEQLMREVTDTFWLLQLSGVLEYESASALQGSIESDGYFSIRQMIQLRPFYLAGEKNVEAITKDRLEEAVRAKAIRRQLRAAGTHQRFRRGLTILLESLHQKHGSERLHQCVRALEALILPATGKTRRQFISRCRTFTIGNAGTEEILGSLFDMRSDVEHVHELDRSLQVIPAAQREEFGLRRTRQVTRLACNAYRAVLESAALLAQFADDTTIAGFWHQPENIRHSSWQLQVNLPSVM